MRLKWYHKTWFIMLLTAFWFYIIPLIFAIILAIQREKILKGYTTNVNEQTYNAIRNQIYQETENERANILNSANQYRVNEMNEIEKKIHEKQIEINNLQDSINLLQQEQKKLEDYSINSFFTIDEFEEISSEEVRSKLALLKTREKEEFNKGLNILQGINRKNQLKQIYRLFNAEIDNILLNLTFRNVDTQKRKVVRVFETLNNLFSVDNVSVSEKDLQIKLEEFDLIAAYNLKKEQEREEQKAIKEQMLEEEKVRREIDREKQRIEKEEKQFKNEVSKLMKYLSKTDSEVEKQLYIEKIRELEEKVLLLEKDKENVLEREQNTRAGFVYIISNIGSFGENIYKIGLTRRLEPMDRIKELSSASVPFEFDVHAIIFSEDAPKLENTLHNHFRNRQVNLINNRKEFFNVSIEEIETVVLENHNATVQFTKVALAEQYRESVKIKENNNLNMVDVKENGQRDCLYIPSE